MKSLIVLAIALTVTTVTNVFAKESYGTAFQENKGVSLSSAMSKMSDASKQEQVIEAKVDKVCEKKGCWMTLTDGPKQARVTFKDYSFFVPISLIGKKVLIKGQLEKKSLSLKEARHYEKDAGRDPNKIQSGRDEYQVIASGVKLQEPLESNSEAGM